MSEEVPPLVCDASAVLNLGLRGELTALLHQLSLERKLVVTTEVAREVSLDDPVFYTKFLADYFTVNADILTGISQVMDAAQPATLDAGEISVLALCLQTGWMACFDETEGRLAAKLMNLKTIGTIGLLNQAMQRE